MNEVSRDAAYMIGNLAQLINEMTERAVRRSCRPTPRLVTATLRRWGVTTFTAFTAFYPAEQETVRTGSPLGGEAPLGRRQLCVTGEVKAAKG